MAGNHKTKLGLAQLKNGLFWLCVSCLVGISISQLWTTFKDWNDHPIESFTVEVPKHKVPFPSVTVCLEVFGLWSDLRSFLNHLEFTDETVCKDKFNVASESLKDNQVEDCFANDKDSIGSTR